MDTKCNSKILCGSLTIIFCIFKQIGYHLSRAMKSGILQQLNNHVSMVRWHAARCPVKTQRLKQLIQTDQLLVLFCKLLN